jgi:hypothetical protein
LKNSAAMDTPKATRAQALPRAQQLVAGTGRERGSTGAHAPLVNPSVESTTLGE